MELEIKYGKRFELNRIKSAIKRLEWYKAHSYKPILPKDITTEEAINEEINKSFNEEEFKTTERKLLKDYEQIKKEFVKKLEDYFKRKTPLKIEVMLTKYGVGGSYNLPNTAIINIQSKKPLLSLLKHEILHLFLEEEVTRKKLTQEEKERLIGETENMFI